MIGINAKRAVERCERLAALGPAPSIMRPWKLRRWLAAYRSIMALDISELSEMLREVYPNEHIAEMARQPNPMLAIVRKVRPGDRKWVEPR